MSRKETYIARQTRRLSDGQINRRRFVMQALATGVSMPTAMSLATRAEALTPRRGGTLRYATGAGAAGDSLDPAQARNRMTAVLAFARANGLVSLTRAGRVAPELAERFEPFEEGRIWVFALRAGVEFHDGRTLGPEDVIASFNRHRDPRTGSAARLLMADVLDIRRDGARGVIFELAAADPGFTRRLADPRLVVLAAEDGTIADAAAAPGTGGYRVESFEPGLGAVLARVPNYWKPGAAHFDGIRLTRIADTVQRHNALMMGAADFIDGVDPRAVALLRRMPTLDILETEGAQHYGFALPGAGTPGAAELARALAHAIRRQDLVDKVLLGHGAAGVDPAGAASFDPDRAAAHFRASGHAGALRIAIPGDAFVGAAETLRLVAASAREAGIVVEALDRPEPGAGGWIALAHEVLPRAGAAHCARAGCLDADPATLVLPLRANDLHAHSRALAHAEAVGADLGADGARIAERWWFA